MMSIWPVMLARAGVAKLLSAWNHGNPLRTAPLAPFMAYMFSPREPATTSVLPCRLPAAMDAITPLWG